MNNKANRTYMGIVMVVALCALLPARAAVSFGIGLTPHGTTLSLDYRDNDHRGGHGPQDRRDQHPRQDYARHRAPHNYAHPRPPVVVNRQPYGRYVNQVERYWVDGYWTRTVARHRRVVRIWNPGYWAERTVRVWVRY